MTSEDQLGAALSPALAPALAHVRDRIATVAAGRLGQALAPGLYLVATPIGNLADITLRAIVVLAQADRIYCEDRRISRVLLSHFGIDRAVLEAYHEYNAGAVRPQILDALSRGERIALISDAGTPLVSDPGYKLVREAVAAGHTVTAVPGACALLAALAPAGLATDTFLFAGFLPPRSNARRARLAELAPVAATLIFYETTPRIAAALADMEAVLGDRQAVLARELTKRHEELRRGTLGELGRGAGSAPLKGEIVVVVAPPKAAAIDEETIRAELLSAMAHASLSSATRLVADALGVPRGRVYAVALALKGDRSGEVEP